VGHYGGSYKVTYDLYKKYGEMRLLDTPICGAHVNCFGNMGLRHGTNFCVRASAGF
jgi:pyruvate/2-oxoglutarate/acetoin dehydrogenase E1 component